MKEDKEPEKIFYLNDDWAVSWDSLSVNLLSRRISKKTGKEHWVNAGYFPNFETTLKGLIDKSTMSSVTLEGIVRRIKELKDEIPALVKELDEYRYEKESRFKGKFGNPLSIVKASKLGKEEKKIRRLLRRRKNESQ